MVITIYSGDPMNEDELQEKLSVYDEIVQIIGEEKANRLCNILGGVEVYLPLGLDENHKVAEIIGVEDAVNLAKYYGTEKSGVRLELPKINNIRNKLRDLENIKFLNDDLEDKLSVYDEIVQIIGEEKANRLCNIFGGMELYLPMRPDGNHKVALVIGVEDAVNLAKYYGTEKAGGRVNLPKINKVRNRLRDLEIIKFVNDGMSIRQAAFNYNLTERWVRYIISEHRRRRRQEKKFGLKPQIENTSN